MDTKRVNLKFIATKSAGEVSGIVLIPENVKYMLCFAHGAGAPMNHPFMEKMAQKLSEKGIGTMRYNFAYIEKKIKSPDPTPILIETVYSAIRILIEEYSNSLPIFVGGKSMGGRMTSMALAKNPNDGIKGIIFFGFPLHPPGKKSIERAEHLFNVNRPMLFLQGTRDKLADLDLLKPITEDIGNKATLKILEGADHSFQMLKSSGKTNDEVMNEMANIVSEWMKQILNI